MSDKGRPSVFLERQSYRQRRLMDGLRLLPFLGLLLWMLPLFWPAPSEDTGQIIETSTAVIYVFVVWLLLILAAFLLSRLLYARLSADLPGDDDQGGS